MIHERKKRKEIDYGRIKLNIGGKREISKRIKG